MCKDVFEKPKRCARKTEVFMQRQPSAGFFKKGIMISFA